MNRLMATVLLLAAALALCVPLEANEVREARRAEANKQRGVRKAAREVTSSNLAVEGEQLQANIEKLDTELTWHDDVAAALRAAKKADKPVFVVNVLGDRCGYV